jgi:hypothetical protein
VYNISIDPQEQKEINEENNQIQDCKNRLLDTYTGLTGMTYRSDWFSYDRNTAENDFF